MRVRSFIPMAALALTAACATTAPTTGTPADEQAIKAMASKYAELWNKHDAKGVAAMVAEDYHTIDANGADIQGRPAFQKAATEQFAATPAGQTLTVSTGYVQWISATAATAGGTWSTAGGAVGAPDKGAWSSTVVKNGSDWLIANNLVAAAPPAAAPMAADTAKAVKK